MLSSPDLSKSPTWRGRAGSRRRTRRLAVAVVAALSLVALSGVQPASALGLFNPPAQPTSGLGANGPCGSSRSTFANPADSAQKMIVFNPTGTGSTPLVGGRCNDAKRPTVVVVHGLLAGIDAQLLGDSLLYGDLINHFVSTGNVVIFSTWNADPNNLLTAFESNDAGIVSAAALAPRADLSRLGIVGHSMGGGAAPYLATKAAARGWGSSALWVFALAPWATAGLGTGPIQLPAHARVVVEAFDNDTFVDNRIGIEQFNAYALPASQKQHVTVRSESRFLSPELNAQHTAPNSIIAPNDAIKFFGMYRVGDALQSCSLSGANCGADLSYMGAWSDGRAVRPAISTDTPVDIGPKATALSIIGFDGECNAPLNPRAVNCPA